MPHVRLRLTDVPFHLHANLLTDEHGLPRFWPMVWEVLHGGDIQCSTLSGHLSAIERLYSGATDQGASLDIMLAEANLDDIAPLLEAHLVRLRNLSGYRGTDHGADWQSAFNYVCDIMERRLRTFDAATLRQDLARIDRLRASFNIKRRPRRSSVRALPASVVEDLYEIADPVSARNPFRTDVARWRNYCLFLLYLHQGLRRSEALLLPIDAINEDIDPISGNTLQWINVVENRYEDDPRSRPASLKTSSSRRQIPISPAVGHAIEYYRTNFRGKQPHSFLFASAHRKPLSVPSVNSAFVKLSTRLSAGAQSDLKRRVRDGGVQPHDFRHTCAVVRLRGFVSSGIEMPLAMENLRVFFGWSKESQMPVHYARAFFEDRLREVWGTKFDERIETLRALEAIGPRHGDNSPFI
jgi:integrase